jgi:hypothetical protein
MQMFAEQHDRVSQVDFQQLTLGGMEQKYIGAIDAGNAPDLGDTGDLGISFFRQGQSLDHGPFVEESENLPEDWLQGTLDTVKFRGSYWGGGPSALGVHGITLRPNFFKEAADIQNPREELATWSDFRSALDQIDEQFPDVYAYEETGTPLDLETYWSYARTAYTDAEDPWLDVTDGGSPEDPAVKVGEVDATDGMIKQCFDLTETYSSSQAPDMSDEDGSPRLMAGRLASMGGAVGPNTWTALDENVEFGWDGDIFQIPWPRLDEGYGEEYGIDELAGRSGQHGGHLWGFSTSKVIFGEEAGAGQNTDLAWDLMEFINFSDEWTLPLLTEHYISSPPTKSLASKMSDMFADMDDVPQPTTLMPELLDEYGSNYSTTGAAWDVTNTGEIRGTSIAQTLSDGLSGEYDGAEATIQAMRDNISTALEENNE